MRTYKYKIIVQNDTGESIIKTVASSKNAARNIICGVEKCPSSAIKEVIRIKKYVTEYTVQGNYGNGWEDLTTSEKYKEAKDDLKSYRLNESKIVFKIIKRKVISEEWGGI